MGRVFFYNDLKNKKIPKISDFDEASIYIQREIERMQAIIGATFFGSFVFKKFNRCSDINVFIIYREDRQIEVISTIQKIIVKVRLEFNIPVKFTLATDVEAKKGVGMSQLFFLHLKRSVEVEGFIKFNPCLFYRLSNDETNTKYETINHINQMRESLFNSWTVSVLSESDRLNFLSCIMSFPLCLARDMMLCLNPRFFEEKTSSVLHAYCDKFVGKNSSNYLAIISDVGNYYQSILSNHLLVKEIEEDEYLQILQKIEALAPFVDSFLSSNLEYISSKPLHNPAQ